jgi:hypothetical protein
VAFEVNGYRLSHLVRDPAAVERSRSTLVRVLAATRDHMTRLGRHDLANGLDDLLGRLQEGGWEGGDAFHHTFTELTGAAADACREAAGPEGMRAPDDVNVAVYRELTWSLVDLAVVRIGGHGTVEHPSGRFLEVDEAGEDKGRADRDREP